MSSYTFVKIINWKERKTFIEQKLRKMSWVQRKIEFQATKYGSTKENHEPARLINDRPPVTNDRAPFNIPTIRSPRPVRSNPRSFAMAATFKLGLHLVLQLYK